MAKADVLVGIYFDAGESSYNAGSVTGYDTARPFSAQNLRLATLVQNDVLDAMNAQGWGIPNLGVVDDSQLGGPAFTSAAGDYGHLLLLGPADPGWFTTPSEMPGALIEPLFITDPFEGASRTARQASRSSRAGSPRRSSSTSRRSRTGPELRGRGSASPPSHDAPQLRRTGDWMPLTGEPSLRSGPARSRPSAAPPR